MNPSASTPPDPQKSAHLRLRRRSVVLLALLLGLPFCFECYAVASWFIAKQSALPDAGTTTDTVTWLEITADGRVRGAGARPLPNAFLRSYATVSDPLTGAVSAFVLFPRKYIVRNECLSPDGKLVACVVNVDGESHDIPRLCLLRLDGSRAFASIPLSTPREISEIRFDRAGRRIAVCNRDLRLVDCDRFAVIDSFLCTDSSFIRGAAFDDEGELRFSLSTPDSEIVRTMSGRLIVAVPVDSTATVFDAALSPDATRLAVRNGPGTTVYDLRTGTAVASWKSNASAWTSMGFSQRGNYLLFTSMTGEGSVWEVRTQRRVFDLAEVESGHSLCISPDERHCAYAQRGSICVFTLPEGKVRTTFRHRESPFHIDEEYVALAFSANGDRLFSTGGEMRAWPL